jgi:hypothetical protein
MYIMENTKNAPRDTFLYLLAIITLVASSVSFGVLVYQFINIWFPDILQNIPASAYFGTIRVALASLVVVSPVFIWVSLFLRKDVVTHPEKQELKIRRWLLYLTVFVAALVIIGDLVTLIYNFLNGDLTTAFILKVIVILFVASSSLFYYLAELRNFNYPRRLFQWSVIGVIVASIIYGFYVAGSPQSQRLIRFDEAKVSNLQTIQGQIIFYWQSKTALPSNLSQLNDTISGFSVPNDPQTNQPYKYSVTGPRSFQLCAVFNNASVNNPRVQPTVYPYDNWQHDAGTICFTRIIAPALYPPISSKGAVPTAPIK